ncbi:MAG: hypothetical protein E7334_07375 [Clostridiales bacterium]|nr:hypothetical protein [Clostridiales bacterium]
MKHFSKAISFVLALCLVLSVSADAMAKTWNLCNGDITIDFDDDSNQQVTQGSTTEKDDDIIIVTEDASGNVAETANTIKVESGEGETAKFTIQNVDINSSSLDGAIDIINGSTVIMTVSGENYIDNVSISGGAGAGIHVGNAELTIVGDKNSGADNVLNVNTRGDNGYTDNKAAGIGSNDNEDFVGVINIKDVDIESHVADEYAGAASIGSGVGGDFKGNVNITDNANVFADNGNGGAGIGSGENGEFAGNLYIKDSVVIANVYENGAAIGSGSGGNFTGNIDIINSDVTADAHKNGAAIGAGKYGDFDGKMNIENSNVTAQAGYTGGSHGNVGWGGNAAAIGAGCYGDFNGEISIKDSEVTATSFNRGAAIGAGGNGGEKRDTQFTGTLNIDNSTVNANFVSGSANKGIPIGAPENAGSSLFTGEIKILGDSEVNLLASNNEKNGDYPLIGSNCKGSTGTIYIEDTAKINAWQGELDKDILSPDDKNSFKEAAQSGGEFVNIEPEKISDIAGGAEVTIKHVPKPEPVVQISDAVVFEVDTFWKNVEAIIRIAEKGDEIIVDADFRSIMPTYILDLVRRHEVTLVIKWKGGEAIVISPDHGIDYMFDSICFETLIALLDE